MNIEDLEKFNIKYVTKKEKYKIQKCVHFVSAYKYVYSRMINGEIGCCTLNGIRFIQKVEIENCEECEKILGESGGYYKK